MENTAERMEEEIQVDDNIEQTKEQQIQLFQDKDPVEVEIVDDTPEKDRNKPKRSENVPPQIPDDDEIKSYSGDVQKRINNSSMSITKKDGKKKKPNELVMRL